MSTADQDILLWESFRKGDKDAFAALFREHYLSLFRFGSKFTPDNELLEDCIQELFIELWQAKSRTPVLSVKGYLLKSLKYKLLRSFAQKGKLVEWQENGYPNFEWSHENSLIAEQEDQDKRRRVLVKPWSRLPSRQKEIIYLKYYQGPEL